MKLGKLASLVRQCTAERLTRQQNLQHLVREKNGTEDSSLKSAFKKLLLILFRTL